MPLVADPLEQAAEVGRCPPAGPGRATEADHRRQRQAPAHQAPPADPALVQQGREHQDRRGEGRMPPTSEPQIGTPMTTSSATRSATAWIGAGCARAQRGEERRQ